VENLKKSFGSKGILKGIDLTVKTGEVVTIIGPSGSGKTTLLRCLNFLERADSGCIILDDKRIELHKVNKKEILNFRRKTAFVFQDYNLFVNKTAIENVMLGLTVGRKVAKFAAKDIAIRALDKVGLKDYCSYYPNQLSGGQQQRVSIARALVLNPQIMFFDEPTSALDPELVGETLNVIKKVANEGMTMIISTHEMSFAAEVASQVVFIDGGVVVEKGIPHEMFTAPKEERTKKFLDRIIRPVNF
jgi:L-cystine transport system ATP-binding protein